MKKYLFGLVLISALILPLASAQAFSFSDLGSNLTHWLLAATGVATTPTINSATLSGPTSGTNVWVGATAKTVTWAGANLGNVSIWLCHPTSLTCVIGYNPTPGNLTNVSSGVTNGSFTLLIGGKIMTDNYATYRYYFNDNREAVLRVCPSAGGADYTSSACQSTKPFRWIPAGSNFSNISIDGVSSGGNWQVGNAQTVSWASTGLLPSDAVGVSACHNANPSSCLLLGGGLNNGSLKVTWPTRSDFVADNYFLSLGWANGAVTGKSYNFNVVAAPVTQTPAIKTVLFSPDSTTWTRGEARNITWSCQNLPIAGKFRVGFYKNGAWGFYQDYPFTAQDCPVTSANTFGVRFPSSPVVDSYPTAGSGYNLMVRAYNSSGSEYTPAGSRVESLSPSFNLVDPVPVVDDSKLPTVSANAYLQSTNSSLICNSAESCTIVGNEPFYLSWTAFNSTGCIGLVTKGESISVSSFPPTATMALTGKISVRLQNYGEYKLAVACANSKGTASDEVTITSIRSANAPTVAKVDVVGLTGADKNHWLVKTSKSVNWSGSNLYDKVALFVCRPDGKVAVCPSFSPTNNYACGGCLVATDTLGKPLTTIYSSSASGLYQMRIGNLIDHTNLNIKGILGPADKDGLRSIRVAVCPSNATNGTAIYDNSGCNYSAPFKLIPAGYGRAVMGAKGHGCVIGTTVSIDGVSQTCK